MMEVSTLCKSITTTPPTEQVRYIQNPMVVDEYTKVFHYSLEHDVLNHPFLSTKIFVVVLSRTALFF